MKKAALTFTLFTAVFLTACNKDKVQSGNNDPNSTELKTFALTAGTQNYQPSTVYKTHSGGTISISSYEGLGASLDLSMGDSLTAGTYTMGPTNAPRLSMSFDALQSYYISTTGSLTIQSHDMTNRVIKGTFVCTTVNNSTFDTLQVTNGQFNVTYPQ